MKEGPVYSAVADGGCRENICSEGLIYNADGGREKGVGVGGLGPVSKLKL